LHNFGCQYAYDELVEPEDLDLPTLVSLTGNGIVRELLARMARDGYPGVRPSHGYVIQRLVADEPTISSLATSLGMSQQGASKQVRELEELGLVERRAVAGDARARSVRLTERGRGALEAGRRARADLEAELVDRLGMGRVSTARVVVATLLELVGLGDQVRGRRVAPPGDGGPGS
jgi:DNA-binding MarR family transcriptional regulator